MFSRNTVKSMVSQMEQYGIVVAPSVDTDMMIFLHISPKS
jgi:hypothetical protein